MSVDSYVLWILRQAGGWHKYTFPDVETCDAVNKALLDYPVDVGLDKNDNKVLWCKNNHFWREEEETVIIK